MVDYMLSRVLPFCNMRPERRQLLEKRAEFILQGTEQDWYKDQAYLTQAEENNRDGI